MDLGLIAAAGIATGTVLLFAAIGEIFAERAGVLNLGVEGMMLMGAVAGFSTTLSTGNPWLGLVAAMVVGGLLGLLHGVVTIHLRADQVVSGLALTFLGTGLARVLGEGLTNTNVERLPTLTIPLLSGMPIVGPIAFRDQSILVYVGFLLVPAAWFWIERTRPGLHLRAVGESPAAADAQGIGVQRLRLAYVVLGGVLAGLAGATITLAVVARLVRRPDRQRPWLDRGRARHLRPLEPDPGRARGLPVRRDLAVHPRPPGRRHDRSAFAEPVPARPLGDVLPRDAAVPVRDRGRDPRLALRGPAPDRGAGRARDPVRPGRTGALSAR